MVLETVGSIRKNIVMLYLEGNCEASIRPSRRALAELRFWI